MKKMHLKGALLPEDRSNLTGITHVKVSVESQKAVLEMVMYTQH